MSEQYVRLTPEELAQGIDTYVIEWRETQTSLEARALLELYDRRAADRERDTRQVDSPIDDLPVCMDCGHFYVIDDRVGDDDRTACASCGSSDIAIGYQKAFNKLISRCTDKTEELADVEADLADTNQALADLAAKLAERETRQSTHDPECWRRHHECAVARIELVRTAIQYRIDAICRRESIDESTKEHEVALEVAAELNALQYARLCWDRAMRGEGE